MALTLRDNAGTTKRKLLEAAKSERKPRGGSYGRSNGNGGEGGGISVIKSRVFALEMDDFFTLFSFFNLSYEDWTFLPSFPRLFSTVLYSLFFFFWFHQIKNK